MNVVCIKFRSLACILRTEHEIARLPQEALLSSLGIIESRHKTKLRFVGSSHDPSYHDGRQWVVGVCVCQGNAGIVMSTTVKLRHRRGHSTSQVRPAVICHRDT